MERALSSQLPVPMSNVLLAEVRSLGESARDARTRAHGETLAWFSPLWQSEGTTSRDSRFQCFPSREPQPREVYRSRIHRYLDSNLPLSDVRAEDQLFAFEVLQNPQDLGAPCRAHGLPEGVQRERSMEDWPVPELTSGFGP